MAQKRTFLPFSSWSPDKGEIGNTGLLTLLNVVPYGNNFIPLYPIEADTGNLTEKPYGMGVNTVAGNTAGWKVYLGGLNDLYEIDPDGTPSWTETNVSKASAEVAIGQFWQSDESGAPDYTDYTTEINEATANDVLPFPATVGANDSHYYGCDQAFNRISVEVGTAGVGTYTGAWEYYNTAGSWATLTVSEGVEPYKSSGSATISFTEPSDWAVRAVNGSSSLYFIRYRYTSGTMTTNPLLDSATARVAQYYPAGEWGWQFLSFGKHVIACSGNSNPVQYRADGAGNFLDMITSTEKPRFNFIATLGGISQGLQIVGVGIGDTGVTSMPSGGDVFAISDVDDIRTFLQGGVLSDSLQYPDDYGDYTGVAGGLDFGALLFKKRAIYMLDNTSPSGFEVRPVHIGDGTKYPNSIFVRGQSVFFWSSDGHPSYWSQSEGYNRISHGLFARMLHDNTHTSPGVVAVQDDNSGASKIYFSGMYDPIMGGMFFGYRSEDASDAGSDRLLSVDILSDKLMASLSDVGTLDVTVSSSILFAKSVPSKQGTFSSYPSAVFVIGYNDVSWDLYSFDIYGTSLFTTFPKFGFGFLPHPESQQGEKPVSWRVTGVRPVVNIGAVNNNAPTWRVTVTWKNLPWEESGDSGYGTATVLSSDGDVVNNEGYMDVGQVTQFGFLQKIDVQFDIENYDSDATVPSWFSHYVGVEIRYEDGGARF